jgi:hypothetical protein
VIKREALRRDEFDAKNQQNLKPLVYAPAAGDRLNVETSSLPLAGASWRLVLSPHIPALNKLLILSLGQLIVEFAIERDVAAQTHFAHQVKHDSVGG